MGKTVKARRPLSWAALLKKGHVHERSKTAVRRNQRAQLQNEIDAYWKADRFDEWDLSDDLKIKPGSDTPPTLDGEQPILPQAA